MTNAERNPKSEGEGKIPPTDSESPQIGNEIFDSIGSLKMNARLGRRLRNPSPFCPSPRRGLRGEGDVRKAVGGIRKFGLIVGLVLLMGGRVCAAEVDVARLPAAAAGTVDFVRDVQPILETSCIRCHGAEKPKGGFRLDSRDGAVAGGDSGAAVITGSSAKSPLIHYVARLMPDMEMPPKGKGDPLTTEQVGVLRAWIDQGMVWVEQGSKMRFSFTPMAGWIGVSGNEAKFREHQWTRQGWIGGVSEFELEQRINERDRMRIEGRVIGNNSDYEVKLSLERRDAGFIRAGFEQFRSYSTDTGGYYPGFTPTISQLDRELHLDRGRAWVDFGVRVPDWPEITLGYEYQYRDGMQSSLHSGDVTQGGETRRIYPAFRDIDETAHILKLDVTHEIGGFLLEDNFRAEVWDLSVQRTEVGQFNTIGPAPDTFLVMSESQQHFQAANTFRVEKQIRDWWFASGGYLYSYTDAEAGIQFNNFTMTGAVLAGDFWSGQSILLDQHSHVFNVSSLFGPWKNFTLSAGVQNEWQRQRGFGNVNLDVGAPGIFFFPMPATIGANTDKAALEEQVSLRYTGLPYTVLFAEARLQQESIGQSEQDIGGGQDFLRDTDASGELYDYSAGFTVSPWQAVSLTTEFRQRRKHSSYTHNVDQAFGFPLTGYSAFITARDYDLDEIKVRLSLKPRSWLRAMLTYQLQAADYTTVTDAEPLVAASPGGTIHAGNHDIQIYSANVTATPWHRLHLSGTVSYNDYRSRSAQNGNLAVVPYSGRVYTTLSSATFVVDKKTDLRLSHSFSRAEFAQANAANGLPLGIDYDLHEVTAGVTRRIRETKKVGVQYSYYNYREPTAGGANDYSAHGIFATFTMIWP